MIKNTDKSSCVVVLDIYNYIVETGAQLGYKGTYKDVNFSDKILQDLVGRNYKMFKIFKSQNKFTKIELKYFTYE